MFCRFNRFRQYIKVVTINNNICFWYFYTVLSGRIRQRAVIQAIHFIDSFGKALDSIDSPSPLPKTRIRVYNKLIIHVLDRYSAQNETCNFFVA